MRRVQGACIPVVPGWLLRQYRKAINNKTLQINFDTYLSNRFNEPVWNFVVGDVGEHCCVFELHGNPDGAFDYVVPMILKRDRRNHDKKRFQQQLDDQIRRAKEYEDNNRRSTLKDWASEGRRLAQVKADGGVSCPGSTITGPRNGVIGNSSES